MGTVTTELIDQARAGDQAAFEALVGPYLREMQVHCYRFLGSVTDAEDALQETLTAAWRALPGFEGRASIRTWLYKIATSRCLNMLRSESRRPPAAWPSPDVQPPDPTSLGEVVWLEPYPDGPEARYESRETISLAFVTALQLLPPRQRAALVLRDVLDFSTREVADTLNTTEDSVASALKRARTTLSHQLPSADQPPPLPDSPAERAALARLVEAFEDSDANALAALMTDDVWVRMPPVPYEYQGRDLARLFFVVTAFRNNRRYRLTSAGRANGQPALGVYLINPVTGIPEQNCLIVITLAGEEIGAITRFTPDAFPRFGLPPALG